ncbi:HU family DNA-binding protein [Bacillus thuringiensis]|nr:HU family DNA-binding protein [Bacillus thuringiensis]
MGVVTLESHKYIAHIERNPRTGEEMQIVESKVHAFNVGKRRCKTIVK